MNFELLTKDDLKNFKNEIISELKDLLEGSHKSKKWLKSSDVKEMLGISAGTLQNYRINGTLPFTKIGKTIFYDYDDVNRILNQNKSA